MLLNEAHQCRRDGSDVVEVAGGATPAEIDGLAGGSAERRYGDELIVEDLTATVERAVQALQLLDAVLNGVGAEREAPKQAHVFRFGEKAGEWVGGLHGLHVVVDFEDRE